MHVTKEVKVEKMKEDEVKMDVTEGEATKTVEIEGSFRWKWWRGSKVKVEVDWEVIRKSLMTFFFTTGKLTTTPA